MGGTGCGLFRPDPGGPIGRDRLAPAIDSFSGKKHWTRTESVIDCIQMKTIPEKTSTKGNAMKQIKTKGTRKAFEGIMCREHGTNLAKRICTEEGVRLTLYYDLGNPDVRFLNGERFVFDRHVGTWTNGRGWYFEKVVSPDLVREVKRGMERLAANWNA